jgi:DNA (cytosine-5)-methyltransferase 1
MADASKQETQANMGRSIPVVDLFAGPGGLGEGFSSVEDDAADRVFDVRLSIEKDSVAHATLTLRAMFRRFSRNRVPDAYYDYVRGDISQEELFAACAPEIEQARAEARLATLGETSEARIDCWIREAIGTSDTWVLIGGPPCQAYSMAGRSRRRPVDAQAFEQDEKHLLYREYLRIIAKFRPPIFVMENVKGILTSKHEGAKIFSRILDDLSRPAADLEYAIRSFATTEDADQLAHYQYVLQAERYGIPQTRHRVILLGVRRDLTAVQHRPLSPQPAVSVLEAIGSLPRVRSRLSRERDSHGAWLRALQEAPRYLAGGEREVRELVGAEMRSAAHNAQEVSKTGGRFIQRSRLSFQRMPVALASWLRDDKLDGVLQHETRAHMRSDLHRYMFASCFARVFDRTPKLHDFPDALLPKHGNVDAEAVPFLDRFRVQTGSMPSTTVVSHISKDGHYYIHPDPAQCRSMTVREAARLQTFPDNYFFEGNRTEQYVQVGNAVPPLLAKQLGIVVRDLLRAAEVMRAGQRDRRAIAEPAQLELV